MTGHIDVVFGEASDGDAGEILTVQRAAFVQEAQQYGDPMMPPLTESLADIRLAIDTCHVIVGHQGHRVVAAGRVRIRDRVGLVGRLSVVPDLQGLGIGRALLAAVESASFADVDSWELYTGAQTAGNLHLYHSAGYVDTHSEHVGGSLDFVHMRKSVQVRS